MEAYINTKKIELKIYKLILNVQIRNSNWSIQGKEKERGKVVGKGTEKQTEASR
jgi:hypothetical protein